MKKVFISQIMNGRTEEAIKIERAQIIHAVQQKHGKVLVLDSYIEETPVGGCVPMKYLAKSIEILAEADIIVMGHGYELARGCVIEHDCAKAYGLDIEYYLGGHITYDTVIKIGGGK